ncbi:hypothetical protein E2P81_ATG02419 [Venturia nashicola]|uniref:Gb n=1 Tax=Venturia nashicola TaxID=86259 RepID=A0A4Z1P559_9PEZI|nr:hypothetical protein E6O75_ATG02478 [Venturia nashicola]TLD36637.1 hypothetical protein E2P81_ATG02419 [Venturia nashicola]
MHFPSLLFFSGISLFSASAIANATPEPTAAPDLANAMVDKLRERQIQGSLPGLSGSLGTDGGCGNVGPISGCFGAAGVNAISSLTQTPVDAKASSATTMTGIASATKTVNGTAVVVGSGSKATSSSMAATGRGREFGGTSVGGALVVLVVAVGGFAGLMV